MKPTILIATVALLLPTLTKADTATWDPEDGVWSDATHWSGGIVPNNGAPVAGTVWDVTLPGFISQTGGPSFGSVLVDSPITIRDLLLEGYVPDPSYTFYAMDLASSLRVTRNLRTEGFTEIGGNGPLILESNSVFQRV